MRRERILLAAAVVSAIGGLWFAWSAMRNQAIEESGGAVGDRAQPGAGPGGALVEPGGDGAAEGAPGVARPDRPPRPPEPNRRFTDFTPEQRVEFARRGHGPGG